MPPVLSDFIRDPRVWIAFAALVVSVVNFIYSYFNNRRQNARWRDLNRPRLRLVNPRLHSWGTVDRKSCTDGTIDYDLLVYSDAEGPLDRLRAHGQLAFHDPATGQRSYGHGAIFTVPDAEAEARRLGLTSFTIVQYLEFVFPFRNTGKLAAMNALIRIDLVTADGRRIELNGLDSGPVIAAEEDIFVTAPFGVPLEAKAPDEMTFEATVTYEDVEGATYEDRVARRWTRSKNSWDLMGATATVNGRR